MHGFPLNHARPTQPQVLEQPNPYGRAILDAVRGGQAVYVGQSAGTVALSSTIGPLTTDPADIALETEDGNLEDDSFGSASILHLVLERIVKDENPALRPSSRLAANPERSAVPPSAAAVRHDQAEVHF